MEPFRPEADLAAVRFLQRHKVTPKMFYRNRENRAFRLWPETGKMVVEGLGVQLDEGRKVREYVREFARRLA